MDKDVSLKDIYNLINTVNTNLTKKIDNIEKEIADLSLHFNKQLSEIASEVKTVKTENALLETRLRTAERQLKRNNLIVYGIVEEDGETQADILKSFTTLLGEKLQINLSNKDFSNCFRLGKKGNRSRPILIEVLSNFSKQLIIRQRAKLRGTNIFINEDLIPEDRNERKVLVKALKEARDQNLNASLKGSKLLVDGVCYTYSDIADAPTRQRKTDYDSPPPARSVVSEPSTPSLPLILDDNVFVSKTTLVNSQAIPSTQSETEQSNVSKEADLLTKIDTRPVNRDNKRKLERTPTKLLPDTRKGSTSGYPTRSNINRNIAK